MPNGTGMEGTQPGGGVHTKLKKPLLRQWWFWAIGGVFAAGLLTVVVFLFFAGWDVTHPDTRNASRVALALVSEDPTKAMGEPLQQLGDPSQTVAIERYLTQPGEVETVAASHDVEGRPAIDFHLKAAAVDRLNSGGTLFGRRIALVLDTRTVLLVAEVRSPLPSDIQLTGNFTTTEIMDLLKEISSGPARNQ